MNLTNLAVLIGLLIQSEDMSSHTQRSVYVVVADNPQSQIFLQELEYDYPDNDLGNFMKQHQEVIKKRCKIIKRFDEEYPEYNYLKEYPVLYYGRKPVKIPPKAYSASGISLITIETLIHNIEADFAKWEKDCNNARYEAESERYNQLLAWCYKKDSIVYSQAVSDFYTTFIEDHYDYQRGLIELLTKKFEHHPDFPKPKKVILPPFPIKEMPFDEEVYE
jgi:hypothetical protein